MIHYKTRDLLFAAFISFSSFAVYAATNTAAQMGTQPDNSAVNERDRDDQHKTADDQANRGSKRDVELTRLIRRDLTKDDQLSTYAKNIKIITMNGIVTLRGPVSSQDEKSKIESVARKIVGSNKKVHNELEVKKGE